LPFHAVGLCENSFESRFLAPGTHTSKCARCLEVKPGASGSSLLASQHFAAGSDQEGGKSPEWSSPSDRLLSAWLGYPQPGQTRNSRRGSCGHGCGKFCGAHRITTTGLRVAGTSYTLHNTNYRTLRRWRDGRGWRLRSNAGRAFWASMTGGVPSRNPKG
jgi:hypothetical protein